jgi:phosphoribosyl 1,2-cyclic phosphodiesterase
MSHRRYKQTFRSFFKKHKYNLTQNVIETTKLAHDACEEGHKICQKQEKVLQTEPDATYRKFKESANMSLLDTSPIWTPVITADLKT